MKSTATEHTWATPGGPGASVPRPADRAGLRRVVGLAALGGLVAVAVPLAAAGPDIVPAAAGRGGDPGWLDGVYGGGLGVDGGEYLGLERIALALYLVALACATALPRRLLAAVGGGLIAAFALAPPLLSLDVFSYVSYARLDALHGLNPYESPPSVVPGDPALAFVADWRDAVSAYGPLFTILTLPLGKLGVGGAVWALKGLAALSLIGIASLLAAAAPARGADPRTAIALVALNPIVLVQVVGGTHNDALMTLAMTAGVVALVTGRPLAGGAGLVAATAIKVSAAVPLPFALIGARERGRLALGSTAAAIAILTAGLALFGGAMTEALGLVGDNQQLASRASLPSAISRDLGLDLDLVRVVALALYAAALAWLLWWTIRGADWIRASGWAMLGLLLATSYLQPWYVIWVLPLAALARDRALIAAAVALTAFLLRYQVPGLGG